MKNEFKHIHRILVRGVNWVGDTILSYPTVEKVKTLFPEGHLSILVRHDLVDLWKTSPYVEEIIPFQKVRGYHSFYQDLSLSLSLRKKGFDLAIILPRSFRSAFQVYLAGIPIRLGYQDGGRSFLLTHAIPRKEEVLHTHRIHYYQKLLEPLGQRGECGSPRIHLREEDRKWAEEILRDLGFLDGRLLIGMNPGATYGLAKCWPSKRFGELGRRLVEKWKATILLFGREDERPTVKEILQHFEAGGVDLTGKTRLLQLAALLERCQLLVTNDTGTMHIGAAVGTPVVALFGSTDPISTGPWGDGHRVIRKDVSCSPCLKRVCPIDHPCMEGIAVEEVEETISQQLRGLRRW